MTKSHHIGRLISVILTVLWFCEAHAQCPNDLCENAIEIGCDPVSFTNADCNLFDFGQNNMSASVGNCNNSMMSSCGAGAGGLQSDVWFSFTIDSTGYYDLNAFSDYDCTSCGSASGIQTYLWYTPTGSCEDAYIVYSKYCPQSVCWAGIIGDYLGDEGGYGLQSYSMMMEFLQTGQYFYQIDAWGWGQNHPDFDYSTGSGTVSICPSVPLSSKPELFYRNSRLEWEGDTQTDWTIFKLIDLTWTEIVRTTNRHLEINESGYYIVAGSTGCSNAIRVEFPRTERAKGFNILGQETDKMTIK